MTAETSSQPIDLVLKQLQLFRAEMARMETALQSTLLDQRRQIGAFADGMVSMRRDMIAMRGEFKGVRSDVQLLVVASDAHNTRLERIEGRLSLTDAE